LKYFLLFTFCQNNIWVFLLIGEGRDDEEGRWGGIEGRVVGSQRRNRRGVFLQQNHRGDNVGEAFGVGIKKMDRSGLLWSCTCA